jgi:uncharacterized protein YjbI with pentapeptide repeats
VGKPPKPPYPPDPSTEGTDELLDHVVEDADWANRREPRFSARRMEFHRVRLTGAQLGEGSLIDVTFADCRVDLTTFRFVKFQRVVFRDCRLEEADFYGAQLTDVLFERCDLRGATFASAKAARVDLRGCRLEGASGIEALKGARMPWNDVLANAPLFAAAIGIEILDEG